MHMGFARHGAFSYTARPPIVPIGDHRLSASHGALFQNLYLQRPGALAVNREVDAPALVLFS